MKSQQAYARLVGRVGSSAEFNQIDELVCSMPITLGRAESSIACSGDFQHLCIGRRENTISRKHGKIYYNEDQKSFRLQCLSKNGIVVDGKSYALNEEADIKSRSAIRLGVARFYFLLPKKETEKIKESPKSSVQYLTYAAMLESAYQTSDLDLNESSTTGATQREIIDWIITTYPNFSEDNKKQNLQQGIYVALNKYYYRLESKGEKSKIRWRKKTDDEFAVDEDHKRKKQKIA
eukprot:CAMPEP_0182417704 /NCGR_PEP_ID=MMETSP1167-20130531/2138_1 /TAXON_ID=2988 /ORGANISM="Mallomonas Sp, Strain CCMP3275" /LENGTH=234 /DNA_ID=CAMNT_0024591425 /DNA_START=76 /DNA_END=780 /DNA_ORIENTATION=+